MRQIYLLRQKIISYYKQYEKPVNIYLKFFIGLYIFIRMGFLSQGGLSGAKVVAAGVFCAVLTAMIPPTAFFALLMIAAGFYLSFASIELALLVMFLVFLIIIFFARLFPVESLLIPAIIIAYHFNIPFAVPIFAGIYVGIMGIIPVSIGTFLWGLLPHLSDLVNVAPRAKFSPLGMPDAFIKLYVSICEILASNPQWIYYSVIFAAVIVATTIVAHLSVNYAKEFSIVAGGITALAGCFIIGILGEITMRPIFFVLGNIGSVFVMEVVKFFEIALDYPSSEKIQFEDDNNYYYVKVIPKIIVDEYELKRSIEESERPMLHSLQSGTRRRRKTKGDIRDGQ